MKTEIIQLIEQYELENKTILKRKPILKFSFDWSGDAYNLESNTRFIAELKRVLE